MSLLESILYGLISGFSEFLPVSSQAHQALFMRIFGVSTREPIRDLLIHIAVIAALLTTCRPLFARLSREQHLASRGRRSHSYASKGFYDLQLIRTATVPLLIGLFFYVSTRGFESKLVYISSFFALNGLCLFIQDHIPLGNKDAQYMTGLDGILIGLCGAVSALPGVSRIGAMHTFASFRGADKHHALNWALLLSLPALILFCCLDILSFFTVGLGAVSVAILFGYILSAITAYLAACFSIILIRFLVFRIGFSGFAYYSCGAALFSLILYLIA